MPNFIVTDQGQFALKGGGGWKRARFVTINGDTTTYQATGFAITTGGLSATATLGFPVSILGMTYLGTSGALLFSNVTYDFAASTIRMATTGGVELGTGNSTAFVAPSGIKVLFYGV